MGSKKPYNPPAITAPGSYLIVEGMIDAGQGSAIITLSRTVNISLKTAKDPESNARVTINNQLFGNNRKNLYLIR